MTRIDAYKRYLGYRKKRGGKMTWLAVWLWIKKYWYIPVFVLFSIVIWILTRKAGTPIKQTITEVKAIQAKADIDKIQAEIGTEKAKAVVTEKYQKEIEGLNEKQKEQAKKLEEDPAKLAKFLVRAGSK